MTIEPMAAPRISTSAGELRSFLEPHQRIFVLTGAGCSTESGIPDYRGLDGAWKRQRPIEFRPFMTDLHMRARYWARSLIGWRSFGAATPNAAHHALRRLEESGRLSLLATQNVDGLHQAAGSRNVIDLHGRLDRVVCMGCGWTTSRSAWQASLESHNAAWVDLEAQPAPDGDADLSADDFDSFVVPGCPSCGGIVKPDVVFFGERVPSWRHAQATTALDQADALLIVGSSLMVYSGYRYAVRASKQGLPIAAVNLGLTRADHLLGVKVSEPAGACLAALLPA